MSPIERVCQVVEARGWTRFVINVLVVRAMALQKEGDTLQALTALGRALSLAEREGYVRDFVDEGEPIHIRPHPPLLHHYCHTGGTGYIPHRFGGGSFLSPQSPTSITHFGDDNSPSYWLYYVRTI